MNSANLKSALVIAIIACLILSALFYISVWGAKGGEPGPPGGGLPPGHGGSEPPGHSEGKPGKGPKEPPAPAPEAQQPGSSPGNGGEGFILECLRPYLLPKEAGLYVNCPHPSGSFFPISQNHSVELIMNGGKETAFMAISNYSDLHDAALVPYLATTTWDLCSKANKFIDFPYCPNGTYTIYVKFYNKFLKPSPVYQTTVILNEDRPPLTLRTYNQDITYFQIISILEEVQKLFKKTLNFIKPGN